MNILKSKPTDEARQKILNRFARIEGQLKGVRLMVEKENQCLNVITQILAVRSALSMLGVEILKAETLCKTGKTKINDEFIKKLFTLK